MASMIFGFLADLVKSFWSDWQASRQNQRDVEKAVTENKIRLAQSEQSHNQAWEMAALEGRDKVLRRVSFVMWSAPMIWAVFSPEGAGAFFTVTLAALPEWYVYGYLAVTGAVWGIAEMRNAGVIKR